MRGKAKSITVALLLVWQYALTTFLMLAAASQPKLGVLAKMLWGINLLWILGFGGLSLVLRRRATIVGARLEGYRWAAFLAGATTLALIEEAITTAMTNCAPMFGAQLGEVYVTASADYLDVVLLHSVVVLIPQFAAWGAILKHYAAPPFAVFLCYGVTGFLNEALFAGPNPLLLAQWILIYGVMVYLPAHLFQKHSGRRRFAWYCYPVAVLLPIAASIPMVALLHLVIAPGHPRVHFPPM